MRVASGILPFVLIHTSVVMECVVSSSFPFRYQPLCQLFFSSAFATSFASRKVGRGLSLSPSIWMRRIQLSVVERVGISFCFSSPFRPAQFSTIDYGVEFLSPQILSFPLPVFLKEGGMVMAVSLDIWCLLLLPLVPSRHKICVFCLCSRLIVVPARVVCWGPGGWYLIHLGCVWGGAIVPHVGSRGLRSVGSCLLLVLLLLWLGLWSCPKIQTTPISGGFLMRSKMSSCTRFLSSNISGCLDVWGTENLSLPGFCCFQPSCLSTGPGVLHPPCV